MCGPDCLGGTLNLTFFVGRSRQQQPGGPTGEGVRAAICPPPPTLPQKEGEKKKTATNCVCALPLPHI